MNNVFEFIDFLSGVEETAMKKNDSADRLIQLRKERGKLSKKTIKQKRLFDEITNEMSAIYDNNIKHINEDISVH